MSRRSLIAVLFLVLAFSTSAFAEREKGFDVDKKVKKLDKKLDLSDEQAAQIKGILEESKPSKAEIEAMKKKHEEKQAKIASVLNDEQKKKYEDMKKDWKKEGKKHGKDCECCQHGKKDGKHEHKDKE